MIERILSIIKFPRSIISGADLIFTAYLYIYDLENEDLMSKFRNVFFILSEENRIIEQQGTVNNRTFVLLTFRSIILFSTIFPHLPGDFFRFHGDFLRFHGDFMGFHCDFLRFHVVFVGFHSDSMGFHGDFLRFHVVFVGFHGDFMGFHGDFMGFHGDFMGFHGDFLRFHGDFVGFLGLRKRLYNSILNYSVL